MESTDKKLKSLYARLDCRALELLAAHKLPSDDEKYQTLNKEANQLIEKLKTPTS